MNAADMALVDDLRAIARTLDGALSDDVIALLRTAADRIVWLAAYAAALHPRGAVS